MTHGSLFSGIGGFDLAAEWMGWENKFHCEWNEFGQKVLKYYWPNAELFSDITKSDFTKYEGAIDIISGGFPCQPYSTAGLRLGKEDDRHLWPEMLRAIREIKPSWVVGENVYGLVNWSGGLVFHEVQSDLEAQGYEVWPFLLPACGVNAPHQRYRIFFVAYSKFSASCRNAREISGKADQKNPRRQESSTSPKQQIQLPIESNTIFGNATNTKSESSRRELQQQQKQRESGGCHSRTYSDNWKNFPTVSPLCNGDDGISSRLDTITFSKWRNESTKAGGNAVVPQLVYQIFKAIQAYDYGNR